MDDTAKPRLTISRIAGDPDQLLDGYRQSSATMDEVGRDHGLILHAAAKTDEGLMIVNLWPSEEGSESASRDPRRAQVVVKQGLSPDQITPEHHELENLVLFSERGQSR